MGSEVMAAIGGRQPEPDAVVPFLDGAVNGWRR